MVVRIVNREDTAQTASPESDLGLHCLSKLFWQANVVFEILEHIYCEWFTVESKTRVKRPLKNRQNKDCYDKWKLNAGPMCY